MDYLKPKSPIAKKHIVELIKKVKQENTSIIDVVVLSNLLLLCYEFGLKKGELIRLSVGDVSKGGNIKSSWPFVCDKVAIRPNVKKMLQDHIEYLRAQGYKLYPTSPLFPARKEKSRYNERTLANHLEKFFEEAPVPITLEKIRKTAVCDFYNRLKKCGASAHDCLVGAADFARLPIESTENLLTDQIKATGKKPNHVSGYLQKIESLKEFLINSKDPKDRGDKEKIRRAICNDSNLNTGEKEALIDLLDKTVQEVVRRPRVQNKPAPEPRYKSLPEAIKNLKP